MTYDQLNLSQEVLQATRVMGFSEMTEIQEKVIPLICSGREVIAKAPTGTGKTCAFGVPIIEGIDPNEQAVQAIILCPTRELATQIRDELTALARFLPQISIIAVYGGQPIGKQLSVLSRQHPQIVVATPGRMLDHLSRGSIRLGKVKYAVLDEADEMLNMGFIRDVRKILDRLPKERNISMFSATISREVMDIGWLYQRDAEEVIVRPVEASQPKITQYALKTTGRRKADDLIAIIRQKGYQKAIVFCNTKYSTISLCRELCEKGVPAKALNGDMEQRERNRIMAEFKSDAIHILVATDVAARGIDVSGIGVVFNHDVPQDNEYYIHRIGRTGRAKAEGVSYLFFTEDEAARVRTLLRCTRSHATLLRFDAEGNLTEDTSGLLG
ncbi:MAG: DEAD/DEAH box helicase [Oscillospiraceae bacterium]|nr:DEAD/DEAH box helicase [Oscillospiraceae bacterium]